jgi:hypothetical protein
MPYGWLQLHSAPPMSRVPLATNVTTSGPVSLGFVSRDRPNETCTTVANIKQEIGRFLTRFSSEVASGESRNGKALHMMWRE